LQQFGVITIDAVLAGQSGERQIQRHAKLGPELLGEVGNKDRAGKESRKLRPSVMKIKIHCADAEERNRKIKRASIHQAGDPRLDALRILVHYNARVVFLPQRPQSMVRVAEHRVVRSMFSGEGGTEVRRVDDVIRKLHRPLQHKIAPGSIQ